MFLYSGKHAMVYAIGCTFVTTILYHLSLSRSYMAGTNFWGTEREKDGFSAPSMDDKLLEVVGITGFTHLATTKVLGIQNQRLAQCRYAKVILQSELPLQVDGEAWIQEAGAILVMHKNRSRMLVKDRVSGWR